MSHVRFGLRVDAHAEGQALGFCVTLHRGWISVKVNM